MTSVLMHTCCAPCSLSCIDPLRAEGIEPVAFWYNPNIHPWKEYEARRDCLLTYAPTIEMQVIVDEDYGLRTFVEHVASDIGHRCTYCYQHRLEETARYAAEHGYEAFTSTLLASLYQDHDGIKAAAEKYARQYGVKFLYRDFRPNFRAGNQRARELGFYMQKYCGCVFSEQDRYQKQIDRDKKKFAEQA
jgi:predicted adenine nucleotide alpha hydrolase (AANH) superfamily ATPase